MNKTVFMTAALFLTSLAQAAEPVLVTLESLPYRDPKPLIALAAMSDSQLQQTLDQRWNEVESLLHEYIPEGVDIFPAPHSFYGSWKSCLQSHTVPACREHINQLIALEKRKAGQP